jgi:hypothetical protein
MSHFGPRDFLHPQLAQNPLVLGFSSGIPPRMLLSDRRRSHFRRKPESDSSESWNPEVTDEPGHRLPPVSGYWMF